MRDIIDWGNLARKLGLIAETERGWSERGGSAVAQAALIEIIGDAALRDAVDFYVSRQPGWETARSVLWHLHPPAAMARCHEIFLTAENEDDRSFAISLLQVVADERVLDWIPLYLADPNQGVQYWGIGIIDQLLFSGFVEGEQCLTLIENAMTHPSPKVRERADELLTRIQEEQDKT